MSTSNRPKGFLDLPQEIRDDIYEYLIIKEKATITMLPYYGCFHSPISAAQPAICCVNKQIRSETLPLFYRNNAFLAELSDDIDLLIAKRWLSAIADANIRHLERLALCGWTKVVFGHMTCRLWMRVMFDLKNGTLEIEGNELRVDEHSHVVKDAKALKTAYQEMISADGWEGFDVMSLRSLMDGFHGLCTSY